jgi:Arc/MetJ family transcription regulator
MQLPIDDNLLQSAFRATGIKNAAEVIEFALRELLRRENQKKILELKGKVEWQGDLDAMRAMRQFDDPG